MNKNAIVEIVIDHYYDTPKDYGVVVDANNREFVPYASTFFGEEEASSSIKNIDSYYKAGDMIYAKFKNPKNVNCGVVVMPEDIENGTLFYVFPVQKVIIE